MLCLPPCHCEKLPFASCASMKLVRMFDYQICRGQHLMLISNLARLLQKKRLETDPTCNCQLDHRHDRIVDRPRATHVSINLANLWWQALFHFMTALASVLTAHNMSDLPILATFQHSNTICVQTGPTSPTTSTSFFFKMMVVNARRPLLAMRHRFLCHFTFSFHTLFHVAIHVITP